jgi:hypothetical protein
VLIFSRRSWSGKRCQDASHSKALRAKSMGYALRPRPRAAFAASVDY